MSCNTFYVGTTTGVFKAESRGGTSYMLEFVGLDGKDVVSLALDCDNSQRIYAVTRNDGVWIGENDAKVWRESSKGLLYKDIWSLVQHPKTGELYIGAQPPAVFKSRDRGLSWHHCKSLHDMPESLHWTFPRPPHLAHVRNLAIRVDDPHWVYGAVEEGWIIRTTDGGEHWETLKQGVAFDAHAVLILPDDPKTILVTSGAGIFRSDNGGDKFIRSDEGILCGLTGGGYMSPAAVHPMRPNVLFVGAAEHPPPFWFTREQGANASFYRSDDRGLTWKKLVARGLPPVLRTAPRSCIINPDNPDAVLFGMTDGGIWLTLDGGASFEKIIEGLPGWIAALCVVPTAIHGADFKPGGEALTERSPQHLDDDDKEPETPTLIEGRGERGFPARFDTVAPPMARQAKVGTIYEITIEEEFDNPFIGLNGAAKIGDADVRIPHGKKGERYTVKIISIGINNATGKKEAFVQKIAGPR